jgi:hypothetical protein
MELLPCPDAIPGMLRGVLGMVLIGAAVLAARALTPAGVGSADAPPGVGRLSIGHADACEAGSVEGSLGGRGGGPGPARRLARGGPAGL